jgi:hypothetical protein
MPPDPPSLACLRMATAHAQHSDSTWLDHMEIASSGHVICTLCLTHILWILTPCSIWQHMNIGMHNIMIYALIMARLYYYMYMYLLGHDLIFSWAFDIGAGLYFLIVSELVRACAWLLTEIRM